VAPAEPVPAAGNQGGSLGGMGAEEAGDPAALSERVFGDLAGALELLTVYLGERLGLYQALEAGGPATSAELAARTGTVERYIREWLEHHAASGLLEVDDAAAGPLARRYSLPAGHVPVLADPDRHEVARDQLLVARVGYCAGEQVPDGLWTLAHDILLRPARRPLSWPPPGSCCWPCGWLAAFSLRRRPGWTASWARPSGRSRPASSPASPSWPLPRSPRSRALTHMPAGGEAESSSQNRGARR